jgi:hypothetical protein
MKKFFGPAVRSGVTIVMSLFVLAALPPSLSPAPHPARQDRGLSPAYNMDEAQKVFRAIDRIKAESPQPWSGPPREIVISESELNSYIAYRIENEHEEIMKTLRLKLFPGNKVEGMAHVDLRGQKAPSYIRPEMDIFFAADLLVANGAVKVDMKKLFVGNEPIQLRILDIIMAISAALQKSEATSLNDWYALPYGIKDVKILKGQALFYY